MARASAGSNIAARMAIIAITTNNSINVNALPMPEQLLDETYLRKTITVEFIDRAQKAQLKGKVWGLASLKVIFVILGMVKHHKHPIVLDRW